MLKVKHVLHYQNSEILNLIRKCYNYIFADLSRIFEKRREEF